MSIATGSATARRRALAAATLLALLATLAPPNAGPADAADAVATAAAERLVDAASVSGRLVVTTDDGDLEVHDIDGAADASATIAAVTADPDVVSVEADVPVRRLAEPATAPAPEVLAADVATATSAEGDDPYLSYQWEHPATQTDATFAAGHLGEGLVIAVLDTGVDADHPDLAGRLLPGWDVIAGGPLDPDREDVDGHGTMVSGTAAANADQIGMRGIAPNARVLPVRVLDDTGAGWLSDTVRGIEWALANGADVINLSLGADQSMSSMSRAVETAVDAGVPVVAAAGNLGASGDPTVWPAAHPDVIAVAAVDQALTHPAFSSTGSWVELVAPGVRVVGTSPTGWVQWHGTSAAAPMVAAGIAVILGAGAKVDDRADVQALRTVLASTAHDLGPAGHDPEFGHGLLRIADALRVAAPNTPTSDAVPASDPPTTDPAPTVDAPGAEPIEEPVDDPEPAPTFSDVTDRNPHAAAIADIAARGVTTGCGDGRYCPAGGVSRGQMSTFLARALSLELLTFEGRFADVPATYPHARAIEALARAGVTGGCSADRFCPGDTVTRAQMASFLTRAYSLPAGASGQLFADVPPTSTHGPSIAAVAAAGITQGCRGEDFCPADPVRRDQMATFLVRSRG